MKTLKFRHHLVDAILNGKKNVTWRFFDDKDLSVGDEAEFIDWETGEKFAKAQIISVREKKLGDLEDSDFEGHEKFEHRDDMLEHYREYYGDKVAWDTIVKIIKFQLQKSYGKSRN